MALRVEPQVFDLIDIEWLKQTALTYSNAFGGQFRFYPARSGHLTDASRQQQPFSNSIENISQDASDQRSLCDPACGNQQDCIFKMNGGPSICKDVYVGDYLLGTLQAFDLQLDKVAVNAGHQEHEKKASKTKDLFGVKRNDLPSAPALSKQWIMEELLALFAETISTTANSNLTNWDTRQQEKAISQIALLIAFGKDLNEILRDALDKISNFIRFEYAEISLLDCDLDKQTIIAHKFEFGPAYRGAPGIDPINESYSHVIVDHAIQDGAPTTIDLVESIIATSEDDHRHRQLAIPFLFKDEKLGVLRLISEDEGYFTKRDEVLLNKIATALSSVIAKAHHEYEVSLQENRLQVRLEASEQLNRIIVASDSLDSLLNNLAHGIVNLFPDYDLCLIWQNDSEKGKLHLMGNCHKQGKLPPVLNRSYPMIPINDSISGLAIQNKKTETIYGLQGDRRFYWKKLLTELDLQGMLAIPLPGVESETLLACINVFTTSASYTFQPEDVKLLENIAQSAAIAFSNLRAFRELKALRETASACGGDLISKETFDKIARIARDNTNAQGCSIFLHEDGMLFLNGTTGLRNVSSYANVKYILGEGMTGWVGKYRKPIRIMHQSDDLEILTYVPPLIPKYKSIEDIPSEAYDQRSFMAVPILWRNQLLGVIRVLAKKDNLPFTPLDEIILTTIANQLASALSAAEEFERREEQLKAIMATLAHQLVAPISAMETHCEELLDNPSVTSERRHKVLHTISNFCQMASNIANNLSVVQQVLNNSDVKLVKRKVFLPQMLKRAAALCQPVTWGNKVDIVINTDWFEEVPIIEADEKFLAQVFINLFENGAKYSMPNTTIHVFLHARRKSAFTLCVRSTGLPIGDDERELIFKRGYRTQMAQHSGKLGTGLGLTVSRTIVQQHGGRIWVESAPSKTRHGAADVSFYVQLPLQSPRS